MSLISESILLLILGTLGFLYFFMPNQVISIPDPHFTESSDLSSETSVQGERELLLIEPLYLAQVFGWRKIEPVVIEVPEIQEEPPPVVDWLNAMGFVVRDDGRKRYIFKESTTQNVFSLSLGETKRGWSLIEITDQGFLFQFDEKEYIIENR